MPKQGSFGARVYLMDNKTVLIYQTKKRGTAQNSPYVVWPSPAQHGAFLDLKDDKAIADAIRTALNGKMV
ncbi:MAG: hypothetical protein Q7J06_07555 [Bacteroidales bacterium]|nr:hypothetical protein [Bacteroidales bacterium]